MDREVLVQAILDLENNRDENVTDPEIAYGLGHHVKDYIDRIVAIRDGIEPPVSGANFEREVFGNGEAPGAAEADDSVGETKKAGANGSDDIAALGEAADEPKPRRRKKKASKKRKGKSEEPPSDLLAQPPNEQARWIFMERYISLERHEEILGYSFEAENIAEHQQAFDGFLKSLLVLPRAFEAAEQNDIPALQKLFASCVLVFRNPLIGDDSGQPVPCTFELLREHYPSYFYKKKKKPNWFERCEFYSEPIPEPHWVLCDTEHLNCTLRKPDRKLAAYARDWDLPAEYVRQKTVLEDIYDRIICGESLEEDLFAGGCNSLTDTKYRAGKGRASRNVYTVQRVHKITIHGKSGVPHWKATKRLWPCVYPTMIVPLNG